MIPEKKRIYTPQLITGINAQEALRFAEIFYEHCRDTRGRFPFIICDFDDNLATSLVAKSFLEDWQQHRGNSFWDHILKTRGEKGVQKCLDAYEKIKPDGSVLPQSKHVLKVILTAGERFQQRQKMYKSIPTKVRSITPEFRVDEAREKVNFIQSVLLFLSQTFGPEYIENRVGDIVFLDDRVDENKGYYPRKDLDAIYDMFGRPVKLGQITIPDGGSDSYGGTSASLAYQVG